MNKAEFLYYGNLMICKGPSPRCRGCMNKAELLHYGNLMIRKGSSPRCSLLINSSFYKN